jgi:Na+/proline symporter
MSALDWIVLLGTTLGICVYGWWHTREGQGLRGYIKGNEGTGWVTIGLGVMATQASAITFLSTPGQGYADGMKFLQIYLGLPIAMVIIAAVFVPIFRRLNVYTAYEYLGQRFDQKTRMLGAALFLIQRGLGAGITIYAPSIIISSVMGWPLNLTIILSAVLATIYTVSGGCEAVNVTQKFQMLLIFGGLIVAFFVIVAKMPHGVSFADALRVAGSAGRTRAIDYSWNPNDRYTLWSGLFGGVFLSLAYFGTDQSQVQRYLSGGSLRESRLGLMFNAVLKIPMQFFILLLGTLVFAFYQFEKPPLFFNRIEWREYAQGPGGQALRSLDERFVPLHAETATRVRDWLAARRSGDPAAEASARAAMLSAEEQSRQLRVEATKTLTAIDPKADTRDTDYVFLTFVLDELPHGVIGLLIAVIFAGGLASISSELNALGSTVAVDFYRNVFKPDATDAHYVMASKGFTALWGLIALAFAFFFQFADNLIQAVNLVGSLFYGPVLGLFIIAFFFKRIGGTAAFWGALAAQVLVIGVHLTDKVAYLWYNPIGAGAGILFSLLLQMWSSGFRPMPKARSSA